MIIFNSTDGKYSEMIDLYLFSSNNIQNKNKNSENILEMDVLRHFDILIEDKYAYLRKK